MTTTDLKPIQTRYAGCHFRSRLEARWAVFFDFMGISWEYEPQGYQLPSGRRYLPDFRLPQCGTYVEVKGDEACLDLSLLREAAQYLPYSRSGSGEPCPGILLLGQIPRMKPGARGDFAWAILESGLAAQCDPSWVIFGKFCKNNRPWWVSTDNWDQPILSYLTPRWDSSEADCLWHDMEGAYAAARSARFEHGESGRT